MEEGCSCLESRQLTGLTCGSHTTGQNARVGAGMYSMLWVQTCCWCLTHAGANYSFVGSYSVASIQNSTIIHNDADEGGGLFATDTQEVWLQATLISSNQGRDGGGLHLDRDATCQAVSCVVSQNTATENGAGAAVHAFATLNLAGTQVVNNKASQNGGGVWLAGSHPERREVFVPFDGNTAMATSSRQFFNRSVALELDPRHGYAVHSLVQVGCGRYNATLCNETMRPAYYPTNVASLVSVGGLFTSNFAGNAGGALATSNAGYNHVGVWDTLLEANRASLKGGAISLGGVTTANLSYSALMHNAVLQDGLSTGGAMDIRADTHAVRQRACG